MKNKLIIFLRIIAWVWLVMGLMITFITGTMFFNFFAFAISQGNFVFLFEVIIGLFILFGAPLLILFYIKRDKFTQNINSLPNNTVARKQIGLKTKTLIIIIVAIILIILFGPVFLLFLAGE